MVIRPNGYSIWEHMQRELDRRIKDTGVRNAYFPLFIPESFSQEGKLSTSEGFAPQCAVVTFAAPRSSKKSWSFVPNFGTIITQHVREVDQVLSGDLLSLINQWANGFVGGNADAAVSPDTTEFYGKRATPATQPPRSPRQKTRQMLKVYAQFSETFSRCRVIAGLKSDSEKFAGALRTYCIEAMMQDKKGVGSAGTSHNLSTISPPPSGRHFSTRTASRSSCTRRAGASPPA